ncbi:MAG: hypothetical protein GC180_01120 [Bacteroidetes bacterium]|nr:hypothetical protein [Bacteroidota bacterium]
MFRLKRLFQFAFILQIFALGAGLPLHAHAINEVGNLTEQDRTGAYLSKRDIHPDLIPEGFEATENNLLFQMMIPILENEEEDERHEGAQSFLEQDDNPLELALSGIQANFKIIRDGTSLYACCVQTKSVWYLLFQVFLL